MPGPQAAVTAGRPPGLHRAGCHSHLGVGTERDDGDTLSISELPEARAMPVLPPGRKSLTVTPCFKHSLVKAFPWQNARQWSLSSLQRSRTLSSLLHLLHPLSHAAAPAMGNLSCHFLILPNLCHRCESIPDPCESIPVSRESIPVSSLWQADSGFPSARAWLSPAGQGPGRLPRARTLRRGPAHAVAVRETLGASSGPGTASPGLCLALRPHAGKCPYLFPPPCPRPCLG